MFLDEFIRKSLEEDIGTGDITTRYLDFEPQISVAYIISKATGVIAGIDIAKQVFKMVDPELKITLYSKDGDSVKPNEEIMRLEGRPSLFYKGKDSFKFYATSFGIVLRPLNMFLF